MSIQAMIVCLCKKSFSKSADLGNYSADTGREGEGEGGASLNNRFFRAPNASCLNMAM